MELSNIYIGNSLDSKSSPNLIQFIPFNNDESKCYYCQKPYSTTYLFNQKYCKHCLMLYIKYTANDNLDVCIRTSYFNCSRHEPRSLDYCTNKIQEWCNSCSEILYFKQIVTNQKFGFVNEQRKKFIENKIDCKLCGKVIYNQLVFVEIYLYCIEFKLCSDCFKISSGLIESTSTKKSIPILYLPWWDAHNQCIACNRFLEFKSNCQKLCLNCKIIYIGCRFCLTTNIIFGIVDQSQCKKCKRMISIIVDITNFVEESGVFTKIHTHNYNQIANYTTVNKNSNPLEVYNFISRRYLSLKPLIDLISLYSQIINLKEDSLPIMFIPFNNDENECCYCKRTYYITHLFKQKYCQHCLILYIKCTASSNLDIHIATIDYQYSNTSHIVQEWYDNCPEIIYFKQMVTNDKWNYISSYDNIENIKYCKLCGKLIFNQISSDILSLYYIEFKLCSDCYKISSGWVESTLTKEFIPILYLPWWDAYNQCIACDQFLEFKSNCQKLCLNCKIIYIGCRYCLTTNIIFGITEQSQCKTCKRMISIIIDVTNIEESVVSTKISTYNYNQIANYTNNKNSNPLNIYNFIGRNYLPLQSLIDLTSYFNITIIEDNDNSFNPTIPIMFIPFNNDEIECCYCRGPYSTTPLFGQNYCKDCLFLYIKHTIINNLDVYICSGYSACKKHELRRLYFCTQNIQEWCNSCSKVLFFKQIVTNNRLEYINCYNKEYIENIKNCKLCDKMIYKQISINKIEFRLCLDCYKISSGWVESTLTKKIIPILYLPWWDAYNQCIACDQLLKFKSNCQKLCLNCKIIYTGCRFCLTTNIIFGITGQSQCKKCKRMIFIINNITNIEENVISTKVNIYKYNQIANYTIDMNSDPLEVYDLISRFYLPLKPLTDLISYFKIAIMEDNEDSFSSIVPIMFIPFNNDENECYYCKKPYSTTLLFKQKYCKHCLTLYIKCTANNNLDVHIITIDSQCRNRHKPRSLDFCVQNLWEWCNSCSEILCFRQIVTNNRFYRVNNTDNYRQQKLIENGKDCKICGKIIYKQISINIVEFKLCLDCYKISSGWVESTLTKEVIPILYLPWWDAYGQCITCDHVLEFKSNCQKLCSNCKIIYIGCNYCLTTNIIFGITDQSQCKRCKRIEEISFITINTKDNIDTCRDINDVIYYIQNTVALYKFNCKIANYMDTINENMNLFDLHEYIRKIFLSSRTNQLLINEIPHSQIKNFKYVAKGGFGIIYKATWLGQDVAVKRFLNSQYISKYFINEVKSLFQCCNLEYIVEVYGISQDIKTKDYMLVMKYAIGGNLHNHLQNNFNDITWNKKLHILLKISEGCWNSDSTKRPSITEITESFSNWFHKNKYVEIFKQAEKKRLELIQLRQLGPEFSETTHSGAIYTSRPLSYMISNLSSMRSFSIKQEYITEEQHLDIDISESKKRNITKVLQIDQGKRIKIVNKN
ncbi:uncharacterized protein OCT59_027488 [Rhizophagus irregularis]|uniref:uncharacterized protein n=1 Tax=Rhizophagus irregularis TaxID=588596 RepID=UPI00332FA89C|nr:hypothetical protein OCT59_027488 [Rhizophagus irregularis]